MIFIDKGCLEPKTRQRKAGHNKARWTIYSFFEILIFWSSTNIILVEWDMSFFLRFRFRVFLFPFSFLFVPVVVLVLFFREWNRRVIDLRRRNFLRRNSTRLATFSKTFFKVRGKPENKDFIIPPISVEKNNL